MNENRNNNFFCDNCWVKSYKDAKEFIGLQVDLSGVYFYRYFVPGRYDYYSFNYKNNHITYFSDCNLKIEKAIKQFKKDLKNPRVKELLEKAKNTNDRYNYILINFIKYFK